MRHEKHGRVTCESAEAPQRLHHIWDDKVKWNLLLSRPFHIEDTTGLKAAGTCISKVN